MPMSMQKLSALRELTIHSSLVPTDSNSLLRDVAFSLKGLHSLRKLCLSGPYSFCAEDLIFIGLSLKAWPLPFLDIMDNKYPILGFRVSPQTRYKGHFVDPFGEPGCEDYCDLPADPAPFAFKRFWRALGLPTEAADWDDGQIVQHWRTMQLKIEAFACIQHSRLCPESLPDLPAETVAMIGHVAADWQRQHFRENEQQRMSEREQAAPGKMLQGLQTCDTMNICSFLSADATCYRRTLPPHTQDKTKRLRDATSFNDYGKLKLVRNPRTNVGLVSWNNWQVGKKTRYITTRIYVE